ncbi:MAG TPA: hypothetical protein VIG99_23680 [Myxococcaceae bacterium]|jgi:hypothetical protein
MSPEKSSESGRSARGDGHEEARVRRPFGRFSRPYYEYKSAMCGAQMDAARRQGEANARFAEAAQHAEKAAFKPAQDAYEEYQRVYQRFQSGSPEMGVADVYRTHGHYLETYHRCQDGARKAVADARKDYIAECESIQKDMGAAQKAAFADYIRSMKDGWTTVDPHAVDAQELGAAAQSMASIASFVISGGQNACMP